MSILFKTVGLKSRIFGYISKGDIVPDVRTTALKSAKIGFIPKELSMQENVNSGSFNEPSFGLG